ncbi:helix-turn-helix transcriptional regulator [Glycomyces sp. TRM65418]|uniref:winged helix-turn-helix transcriptional regulator n=1 Tax=Glycomyces sp. TRM65418 TaxID=2867006 RepID=UPI001CE6DD1E|nr:helix-turn-helix domain-containing protein [Glycomyces sp. TRM65418]MCC3764799.1 helix-turn-helix transcriptional regulator [Glycomyces sp. TRM65418]QZD54451.1 helix-turn-helix transcriptional regulator [Glycomyces sp. TRM65418]
MDVTPAAGGAWTDPACPVARTVDLVGDRWSLLIIRDAMDGATTFTEFRERLGIARNILTDRLRRLVEHGILEKGAAADGRSRTYRLTEAGQDLFTAVVALRQWGERHAFAPGEPHSVLVDDQGRALPELRPHGQDGRPVTVEASHVRKAA